MINKQDYINSIYQDIDMVKGDTLAFNFQVSGLSGISHTVAFTCKEHYDDDTALFSCSVGSGISVVDYDEDTDTTTYVVSVAPSKTAELDLGRYYYDLQLTASGNILTLMRGRLTLVYEVTT